MRLTTSSIWTRQPPTNIAYRKDMPKFIRLRKVGNFRAITREMWPGISNLILSLASLCFPMPATSRELARIREDILTRLRILHMREIGSTSSLMAEARKRTTKESTRAITTRVKNMERANSYGMTALLSLAVFWRGLSTAKAAIRISPWSTLTKGSIVKIASTEEEWRPKIKRSMREIFIIVSAAGRENCLSIRIKRNRTLSILTKVFLKTINLMGMGHISISGLRRGCTAFGIMVFW